MADFDIPETEADAYQWLESIRWPTGRPDACPKCSAAGQFYFLTPEDGTNKRKTRTGSNSERRVWTCGTCRKQFSVLTGTVMQGTRVALRTWIRVIAELGESKRGLSSREVAARYGLSPGSAWSLLSRISEATSGGRLTRPADIFLTPWFAAPREDDTA